MAKQKGIIGQYDESKMDDEARQELEEYVLKGYNLIYNDSEGLVNAISKYPQNKVKATATAGYLIGKKLDQSRETEQKPPFRDEIKAVGGYHLVDKLAQFAELKGVKFRPEEKQAALKGAYEMYIKEGVKNHTINPLELAAATEQAKPGSVSGALAEIPDRVATKPSAPQGPQGAPPQGMPGQGGPPQGGPAQGTPPQGGQMPQGQPQGGLLSQPSPLAERGLI